ncbi:MAG: UTP--glucose-1-phosphate uridylyltransferase [Chlamydiales bacterium]
MDFNEEIKILTPLVCSLKETKDLSKKQAFLLSHPRIKQTHWKHILPSTYTYDPLCKIVLLSLIVIRQEQRLFFYPQKNPPKDKLSSLLGTLIEIDQFYQNIGGLVGYQLNVLQRLEQKKEEIHSCCTCPSVIDLTDASKEVNAIVAAGIEAIPEMGEIYPVGGLGSRLNLMTKEGAPLPVASLKFLGRTLLHGLLRDVQAREFLYYRLFGKQVTVPIAMMTSREKKNALIIREMCEKNQWFGRPKESFFLFSQLSVPVVDVEGNWVMHRPLEPILQPGGHGALWQTADKAGVFDWFLQQKKHRLIIRQINNPIGGVDYGLLALLGVGKQEKKKFGIATCQRQPETAEGVLVLKENEERVSLSHIEYTDFNKYGLKNLPEKEKFSLYPANTNLLYADIKKLRRTIKKFPLPGLILNIKNTPLSDDADQRNKKILGGRLESMMQNISEALSVKKGEALSTFLTYNTRRRTISTTKRSFIKGEKLIETPEGAFYDMLFNGHALLRAHCNVDISDFCSAEDYLAGGPSHLFLYHPALGPLYSLIAQKIQGGKLFEGAELQLEIADLKIEDLELQGSLLIQAQNLLGYSSQGILHYGHQTGKCVIKQVHVKNAGICRTDTHSYWQNQIKRQEALKIILEGHSEFYAENILFEGNQTIVVPEGERWIAKTQNTFLKEKVSWDMEYTMNHHQLLVAEHGFS